LPIINQANKEWGSSLLGQLLNKVSMGGNCGQFLWETTYGQVLNVHTNWKEIIFLITFGSMLGGAISRKWDLIMLWGILHVYEIITCKNWMALL
jgi:hypothetical protein